MKTTLYKQAIIIKAVVLAVLTLILLPAMATAGGSHYSGHRHSDKHYFGEHSSGEDSSRERSSVELSSGEFSAEKHISGKQCDNHQCDNSLSVPLYINGDKRVGKVTVRLEQNDLKVTYQVKDGWMIKQTNLDIANSYNGLHINDDGSPRVAAFPYKTNHFMPVKSAQYTISARQWPLGTQLYVSAQAIVLSENGGKCEQRTASTRHHHDGFSKEYDKEDGDSRDFHHEHHGHDDKHDDVHDDVHNDKHHDKSDDSYEEHVKTISNESWAVGEIFPGQKYAAYFIYTLKSCDTEQQSSIQFSDAIYSVNEGDAQVLITVTRSGNLEDAASVNFTTADGTAQNGLDYVFISGVLDFAPGQASAQFAVAPIDDSEVEPVESLNLQLSNAVNATLGQQISAVVEIQDNDVAPATIIEFSPVQYSVLERTPIVTITVIRSGDLSVESQVDFTTADGTATVADGDYIANSGTLVFPAGVATMTFQVVIINDRKVEPDETVLLKLLNPGGAALGTQSEATLVIQNDDGLPS